MKLLLPVGLAATLVGCAAAGTAGRYDSGPTYVESEDTYYRPPPYYRHDETQYYEPRYHRDHRQSGYDYPRRQSGYDYPPVRYRTGNGCQPGYTVQDGVCKPYRGY
jgi:hypothetical protein